MVHTPLPLSAERVMKFRQIKGDRIPPKKNVTPQSKCISRPMVFHCASLFFHHIILSALTYSTILMAGTNMPCQVVRVCFACERNKEQNRKKLLNFPGQSVRSMFFCSRHSRKRQRLFLPFSCTLDFCR